MSLSQGQVINNRYRIVKLLGQGGFGAVYRAWDVTLDRPCAVKESFELSPEGQRQFLREARILARLSHANLPRVTDYFTLPGQGQFLVMDYVEGQDLEELRAQAGGRLSEKQVLPWIAQVCEALEYLHSQQPAVIHRDIKPANIKITPPDKSNPQGRAMLVDFGVAKVYDPALRTTMGARSVTPGFSPHEQYGQSQAATDARTDIYALGATLYMLLSGQEPPESILRMVSDPLAPPRRLAPAISPAVEVLILKAMQMDPGKRFQSAAEFSARISNQLAGSSNQSSVGGRQPAVKAAQSPAATPPPSPLSPASPPVARKATVPAAPAPSPLSPASLGVPLPPPARPSPWPWLVLGVLVGLAMLAMLAGVLLEVTADSRATQTAQARATQTTQARATQTARAVAPVIWDGTTQVSPVDGMLLSYIPAGSFQMGSESGEVNEQPVYSVTLDAFWMDQTEVTNGMYAQCVAGGVCNPPDHTGSNTRSSYYGDAAYAGYPVTYVDWNQASAYCAWAGRQLPTEAQWDFAARGGLVKATYPWGNEAPNCTLGGQNGAQYWDCSPDDTIQVGGFAPNGYGLYDMAGNVWEWVADWYGADFYSSSPLNYPSGPVSGDARVRRGGAWYSIGGSLRVSSRSGGAPDGSNYGIGFRCSLSP